MNSVLKYKLNSFTAGSIGEALQLGGRDDNNFRPWQCLPLSNNIKPGKNRLVMLELEEDAILRSVELRIVKRDQTNVSDLLNSSFRFAFGLDKTSLVPKTSTYQETHTDGIIFHFHPPHDDGRVGDGVRNWSMPVKWVRIDSTLCGLSCGRSSLDIELRGVSDKQKVEKIKEQIDGYDEQQSIRITLKFLRQRGFMTAFDALLADCQTGGFEQPVVSSLYNILVQRGDYDRARELIMSEEMAPLYCNKPTSRGHWKRCQKELQHQPWPGARGGHQMVIHDQTCYLFGGWTGGADLGDFWSYDIKQNRWKVLNKNAQHSNGPCPRSCHKMAIDSERGIIYTLGRYVDNKTKQNSSISITSDFYQYDIKAEQWTCISRDVEQEGGPALIFDHQVVFHSRNQTLWCFGGRIIASSCDVPLEEQRANPSGSRYSGLYKWVANEIDNSHRGWSLIRPSCRLIARAGHCMILNEVDSKIYILGGMKSKEELNDFLEFDIDTETISTIHSGDGPGASPYGITQRAYFNSGAYEIRIVIGSGIQGNRNYKTSKSNLGDGLGLWIYRFSTKIWYSVKLSQGPVARFAHSLAVNNEFAFLFGGNPGNEDYQDDRLDDFWLLCLEQETRHIMLQKCKTLLLKCQFIDLKMKSPTTALSFLRSDKVSAIPRSELLAMSSTIFDNQFMDIYQERTKTFSKIINFLHEDHVEPRLCLKDLVSTAMQH